MIPITVQDLSAYKGEPRILDIRIAEALEYAQPRDIRKLIARNMQELEMHGEVFATMAQTPSENDDNRATMARFGKKSGPIGAEYLLNMAQAIVIAMFSKTPKAVLVRKQLVEVFLEWHGARKISHPLTDDEGIAVEITSEAVPVLQSKLALVRECRHLWGHERARQTWRKLGLPMVEEPEVGGQGEARDCLATILIARVGDASLGSLLNCAMDDKAGYEDICKAHGLWPDPDRDGFVVANHHPALTRIMEGSRWPSGWGRTLRRLNGAAAAKHRRYGGDHMARGTFLPSSLLDTFAN